MRSGAATGERPSVDTPHAGRTHSCLSRCSGGGKLLPRHLGRAAVQAWLAHRRCRRPPAREPCRGDSARRRLASWRAAARPDVRRRHYSCSRRQRSPPTSAPGLHRSFGFQKLAWFDGPAWQRLKQKARDQLRGPRLDGAHRRQRRRPARRGERPLERRGGRRRGLDRVRRRRRAGAAGAVWPSGIVIANPPYGVRLECVRFAALYPRLGDALKARYAGWTACSSPATCGSPS